jgi:hypothetical protein
MREPQARDPVTVSPSIHQPAVFCCPPSASPSAGCTVGHGPQLGAYLHPCLVQGLQILLQSLEIRSNDEIAELDGGLIPRRTREQDLPIGGYAGSGHHVGLCYGRETLRCPCLVIVDDATHESGGDCPCSPSAASIAELGSGHRSCGPQWTHHRKDQCVGDAKERSTNKKELQSILISVRLMYMKQKEKALSSNRETSRQYSSPRRNTELSDDGKVIVGSLKVNTNS